MFDKIRVLLIDDLADAFKAGRAVPNFSASADQIFGDYFDVQWVKTPQELRAYFDLPSQVIAKDPTKALAVLPEAIDADYALTDSRHGTEFGGFARTVEADVDALDEKALNDAADALGLQRTNDDRAAVKAAVSPLPALRDAANELWLPDDLIKASEMLAPPPKDVVYATNANDHMGAQAATLIYGLYAQNYGVALIPHTAHAESVNETETAFLEWMLTYSVDDKYDDKNGVFATKGAKEKSWRPLLAKSMRKFRARTAALAETGVVRVSLDTLCRLKSADAEMPESIRIESKFGARALPLRGLFIDFLYDDNGKLIRDEKQAEQNVREAARDWAQDIIHRLYVKNGGDYATDPKAATPIERGLELSNALWESYASIDLRRQRWALSNACGAALKCWQENMEIPEEALQDFASTLGKGKNIKDAKRYLGKYLAEFIDGRKDGVRKDAWRSQFQTAFGAAVDAKEWRDVEELPCMASCRDVKNYGDYSDAERRWAVLFTWRRLYLAVRKVSAGRGKITAKILYDALYPLPKTPLILPWDPTATAQGTPTANAVASVFKTEFLERAVEQRKRGKNITENEMAVLTVDALVERGFDPPRENERPFLFPDEIVIASALLELDDCRKENVK